MPHRLLVVTAVVAAVSASVRAQTQIVFQDISAGVGLHDVGLSFGASAGDVNGDGLPDLFTGGHFTGHPHLWLNLGGHFVDVTAVLQPLPTGDLHGAQFVDFDNDAKTELIVMRGANYGTTPTPKLLYHAFPQGLFDVASFVGLDVPLMRARTPVAGDYDGDGALDVFLSAMLRSDGLAPPAPYLRSSATGFAPAWQALPSPLTGDCLFAVLGDLDGDRTLDMLLPTSPLRAMSFGPNGSTLMPSGLLPPLFGTHDAAVADFDGDGQNEIYLARDQDRTSLHQDTPAELQFHAIVSGQEHGVTLQAPSNQKLLLEWGPVSNWLANDVFVGAGGRHPTGHECLLDPADVRNIGMPPRQPGVSRGIFVGRDPVAGTWTIAVSSPIWAEALVRASVGSALGAVTPLGWNPGAAANTDLLLSRVNGHYVDVSAARGIPPNLRSRSVVAADFDHDMDLDLYLVTATTTHNTPNVLLVNQGNGVFVQQADLADNAGSPRGIGDSVITLDHDRDGDLDLLLVNGDCADFRWTGSPYAFGDDGPVQLLRNDTSIDGPPSHWLAIELRGTTSNRDAIGSRIEVTAGGRTQVREHGGGMHRYSQNHGLHFGLGANTVATRVEVFWPNGTSTVRFNVPADQVHGIVQ